MDKHYLIPGLFCNIKTNLQICSKFMRNIILYIVILFLFLFYSCSTEFDVNADWEDITIVYCLLNIEDSIHYVKVNKAFLGEENAYITAQISDSLYYSELTVALEEWQEGANQPYNIIDLVYNDEMDKEPGLFAHVPNILYTTTHELNPVYEYKLNITVPDKDRSVSATTELLDELKVSKPTLYPQEKVSLADTYTAKWESTENARIYELTLRFHYLEVIAGDTSEYFLDYGLPSRTSDKLNGGQKMEIEISGGMFMSFLASNILVDENVRRLAHKKAMDFMFVIGDDDLNTYIEVSQPSTGIVQDKPTFSNINNGIGLFASRFNKTIFGKSLTNNTLDSLAYGASTKYLNFADHFDLYYYINTD